MHRRSLNLVFLLLVGWLAWIPSVLYAQTLAWDPNPESNIAGYRLSRGTAPGSHPITVDVGNTTTYQPSGVDWSVRQYFVVTAYNTSGLESGPSNEAVWTPPSVTTLTSLSANTSYPLVAGRPVTWTAIGTNNLGPVEYRFYLYRRTGWTMVRDYATDNTWTWTPGLADQGSPNYLQIWARAAGSTALFEAWLGTQAFEILPPALQLSANVDFPTPLDNVVTWTASPAAWVTTPLEYQFQVMNQSTGNWTVFRGYAPNRRAQWIPGASGSYAIRVWARPVGSTVQYESEVTSTTLAVQPTAVSIPALYVDTTFPTQTGKPMTWTARLVGGMSGPLQYQFWLYSATTGWRNAQPYGPSQSFTWTPTWGDEGVHYLQVWARGNGSTQWYEAWYASGAFTIDRADVHLTTPTLFPAPPGRQVQWTANVSGPAANVEYQFQLYSAATGQWTIARPYGATKTFAWVPATTGSYAVQAWVRQIGSTAQYEALAQTSLLEVSASGAHLTSVVSNLALPVVAGTTVTWTAAASGGTAPLEYQFWRDDGTGWLLVQGYSAASAYSWTTSGSAAGQHNLQVRVRSIGSAAAYESYMITGAFSILP